MKLGLTYLILLGVLLTYGYYKQHRNISHVPPKAEAKEVAVISPTPDNRAYRLKVFFQKFNSPFDEATINAFIEAADQNNLDWRLLPSVSCAESSCGKYYKNNAFGWGNGKIDYGTNSQDIMGIARVLTKLSYYKTYIQSGKLYDFSYAYNRPYWQTYLQKINWFYKQI